MVVKGQRLERGEATRSALVSAARKLFGAKGYAATSLEEIVSEAGVTKGALYHHFSDKETLFLSVAEAAKHDIARQLSGLFLDADPFDALIQGCEAILDAYLDPAVRQIVWVDARAVLGPAAYQDLQSRYEPVFLRAALRRAMRTGTIEVQPLRPLALLLTGAIGEACALVAGAAEPGAARAEVGTAVARLLIGLQPR
jgi:AcrR family transcriptional regulator